MSIDITTLALAKEYTNRMVGSGGTGGGVNGKDGITPHIGDNGNWFIGTVDTGISAQGPAGENGVTPHIGTNGNWYIGSVNTGVSAKGAKGDNGLDGNGIKSAILNSDYTLTLTFDDGTTYTTPSIRGATGDAGSAGKNGTDGKDGSDGVGIASIKQTTTSTADGGNNVFTVTLTNGTIATFTVKNGSKGSTGKDGSNGVDGGHYTPVVTQPTTDTMQISFAPSKSDMPAVNPVTVNLPVSENSGQNVVDVTHYGAMGDGQTDDTEAIATAMAAVPTGGTLYFPAGTYMVDNVFAKSDMTIRGDGWGSVIKLLPARTNYHGRNSCINIENVERVIVRDIKLDGDRATQQATAAAQDQRLNGLFITSAKDVYIENVWMYNNGYHGCIMVEVENVTFSHCRSSLNGFRPIHGHTEIYNVRVSNCICEDNGKGLTGGSGFENDAVFFFGVQRLTINDNIVRSNRRGCICVGADHSSVTTGTIIPSGSISITGNVCECYEDLPYVPAAESDTGVAKFSSQGIVVYGSDGEMRNVTVSGNTIKNAHEAIYLYASDNLVTSLNAAVTGNTIIDCSIGVKAVEVADITITGNQFRNLAEQMMYAQSVERLLVSGNNVYAPGTSEYRLCRVHGSSNVVITGNQFVCPARIAVYAPDSNANVVITNNVMLGFTDENPITNTNGVTQNNIIGQTAVEPEPDDGGDAGDGDYPDDGGDAGDGDYPDDSDVETEKVYAGAYENAGFVRLNLASPNTGSAAYVHTTPIPMTDADIRYELNTYVPINDEGVEPEDYTGIGADKEPSIVFLSGDDHMTDAVGIVPMFTRTNGTWSYNANNFITNATNRIFGFTISISAKKVRELFPTATHVMFQVEKNSDPDAVSSMTFGPLGDGKSYVYRAV